VTGDADYHYYAERDEHEVASGIEDVPEAHDGWEDQPGDRYGREEDRLGSHHRGRRLAEEQ
jgi:hypothetical protein